MALNLFKKIEELVSTSEKKPKKEWYEIELERMTMEEKEVDKEITEFNNIRYDFENGADIQECANKIEDLLSSNVKWNKSKLWLFLVKLYKKQDDNKAWETLQRYHNYVIESDYPIETKLSNEMEIYYEEFKILKKEKRYSDALCFLLQYYVLRSGMERGDDFYLDRFLKEANTTMKNMNLSNKQVQDLVTKIQRIRKSNNVANDARKVYINWIKTNGIHT